MAQVLIVVLFLFVIFSMPFSKDVRVKMFARDNATCQGCGKKWGEPDYAMLHATHINHKRNKWYNSLRNGRMLCIDCHIEDHKRLLKKAKTKKERNIHAYAIRKLSKLDRHNIHFYKSEKPPR